MLINELNDYLDANYSLFRKPISELAGELKINDRRLAYNYDGIKDHYCKHEKVSSADVLLAGVRTIYFIEFKSGFARVGCIEDALEKAKKEGQRARIRLKACESLILFEKVICKDEELEFNKVYVSVIDCADTLGVMEDILLEKAGTDSNGESFSERAKLEYELKRNSLLVYKKEIGGEHIMYDDVLVLYDYEYNEKAQTLLK